MSPAHPDEPIEGITDLWALESASTYLALADASIRIISTLTEPPFSRPPLALLHALNDCQIRVESIQGSLRGIGQELKRRHEEASKQQQADAAASSKQQAAACYKGKRIALPESGRAKNGQAR